MSTLATTIKQKIKAKLDALVVATTLAEVQEDDFKTGIFDRDFGAFPVAVLTTPAIEGGYMTNRQNMRNHTFAVVVICKAEDITAPEQVESLIEILLDTFDNDPTLTGTADGGVEPSSSSPEAHVSRGKTYIYFALQIKVKAVKDLTFT